MANGATSGGLAGKILRVNLSDGKIWTEDTEKYAKRFLGGRMISSYILLNETKPDAKWTDPENPLIFAAGTLVGTLTPGACRTSVETINAYNNGKGSANFGGHFGAELKFAGFDNVVITGKAEKPVYLWISDGKAEIRDAGFLWGKGTFDTQRILQEDLNDIRIRVASIGPAGEKLVVGAGIMGDTAKVAGGSGVGCVMGDKKLKALAVRGKGEIKIAEPEKFIKAAYKAMKKCVASPNTPTWRKTIIAGSYYPESPVWDVTTLIRNGQDEWWPMEKKMNLCDEEIGVPRYRKKVMACYTCPIGCIPYSEMNEGKYKGTKGSGYWINSAQYAQKYDVDDPEASLKWHILSNDLGIDGDMASVSCSWAFECYEKGLLTKEDTDGLELTWGNGDSMVELLRKVANREGFGDFLADGVLAAARKLGKGSEYYALHIKGQDTEEDFRILKGWGLGVVTSPCSGRHLRGAVSLPSLTGPPGLNFDPNSYEKAPQAVYYQSRVKEIEDALGVCVYMGSFMGAHALFPPDYVELLNSATGWNISEEELHLIGLRGYNLEKAFNTIHTGFDRTDDLPPERFMKEPVKSGPFAGMKADKEGYEKMLDKFYELQGWDKETGWQTAECLKEVGLEDIAEKIRETGRLKELQKAEL